MKYVQGVKFTHDDEVTINNFRDLLWSMDEYTELLDHDGGLRTLLDSLLDEVDDLEGYMVDKFEEEEG